MVTRALYAALSFVGATMLSTSCFAFDYAGDYRANGKDFRGGDYKGKAQITHIEGSIYNIFWAFKIGGRVVRQYGVCVGEAERLSCGYQPAIMDEPSDRAGIVIYFPGKRKLTGQWTRIGSSAFGSEVLTPID